MRTPIRRGPRPEQNWQGSWQAVPVEVMRLILGQQELTAIDLVNFAATEKRAVELVNDDRLWRRHGLHPPFNLAGAATTWAARFRTLPPAVQDYMMANNADVDVFSNQPDRVAEALAAVDRARVAGAEGAIDEDGDMRMHEHLAHAAAIAEDEGIVAPTLSDDEMRAAYQRGMEHARGAAERAIAYYQSQVVIAATRDAEEPSVERVVAKVERLVGIAELYAERGGVPFVPLPAEQVQPIYQRATQRCRETIAAHLDTGDYHKLLQAIRDANNYAAKAGEPRVTLDAEAARACFRTALRNVGAAPRAHRRGGVPPLQTAVRSLDRPPADGPSDPEESLTKALSIAMDNALYKAECEARMRNKTMMQIELHHAAFFALAAGEDLPETAPDWYQRAYEELAAHHAALAVKDREGAKFSMTAALNARDCLQKAAECAAAAADPQTRWALNRLSD